MRAASERHCDLSCMEVKGHRKPEPRARGPHFQPPQTADRGGGRLHRPLPRAISARPSWPPQIPSSDTGKRKFRGTKSQGPATGSLHISSSNSKQHSRITHFCFHPSVCGNRDSNAGCGVSQQRRFCLLPQGGSDPGASSTAEACRVVFPHWRALSPGLSSNRIVTKQIRDPWAIHPLAEPG